MEEEDEVSRWIRQALEDPREAALVLMRILREAERRKAGMELEWGLRRPRSFMGRAAARESVEEDEKQRKGERGSPATPLDFSVGSVSAGEEGSGPGVSSTTEQSAKTGGVGNKVVLPEMAPAVYGIPAADAAAAKPIRRHGKKKTISELQEVEKSLLDERKKLQKELEGRRRAHGELLADNQRLKRLKLSFQEEKSTTVSKAAKQFQSPSASIGLFDLNEPPAEI